MSPQRTKQFCPQIESQPLCTLAFIRRQGLLEVNERSFTCLVLRWSPGTSDNLQGMCTLGNTELSYLALFHYIVQHWQCRLGEALTMFLAG